MPDTFDAIIVGSGAGGGTAARVLTERGFRVVVFEKGEEHCSDSFLPYDELHFKFHEKLIPSVADDPVMYMKPKSPKPYGQDVKPNGEEIPVRQSRWWCANILGGATQIWDANFPRYTREDMEICSIIREQPRHASLVDWPWTYEEFQPYYERAEWEWGVSGRTGQGQAQEPHRRGYNFPMPPVRPHASTPLLKKIFNKVGWHPYLGAKAINSRTYDGRPAWPFSGFFAKFADPTNSRATAANTVLPKAIATGRCEIRTGHCVTRIDHDRSKVKGVSYKDSPGGKEKHMEAPIVIVSVQAIESARLFLISDIPDPNDMIGHYLTYHTKGAVIARFKDQPVWDGGVDTAFQPRTGIGSLEIRDLYRINDPDEPGLTKGGKFAVFDPFTTAPPISFVDSYRTKRGKLWGRELIEELKKLREEGGVGFSFTGEALPVWENRVELDNRIRDPWGMNVACTYYQHHDYDLRISKYATERMANIIGNAGGEIVNIYSTGATNTGYGHNHGTLRAGRDPGESVLDTNCQSHEVEGLYVLDCAWMPTSGASNPTLTLLANAYRVCDRIPKPG